MRGEGDGGRVYDWVEAMMEPSVVSRPSFRSFLCLC